MAPSCICYIRKPLGKCFGLIKRLCLREDDDPGEIFQLDRTCVQPQVWHKTTFSGICRGRAKISLRSPQKLRVEIAPEQRESMLHLKIVTQVASAPGGHRHLFRMLSEKKG